MFVSYQCPYIFSYYISKLSYLYNHPDESPHVLMKSLDHKIDC